MDSEISWNPVCIRWKHLFEIIDRFILSKFHETRQIFIYHKPRLCFWSFLTPRDILEAKPNRRWINDNAELLILFEYNFIFLLISILHNEISKEFSILDFDNDMISLALGLSHVSELKCQIALMIFTINYFLEIIKKIEWLSL